MRISGEKKDAIGDFSHRAHEERGPALQKKERGRLMPSA